MTAPPSTERKRAKRGRSLAQALKAARDAGKNVRAAQLKPDGEIDLTFGEPEGDGCTTDNPWLADLKVTKQ